MLRESEVCGMLCDGLDISVQAQQQQKSSDINAQRNMFATFVSLSPKRSRFRHSALHINCVLHFFCKRLFETFFTKTNFWRATIEMHVERSWVCM
jgi:hypothetical protein